MFAVTAILSCIIKIRGLFKSTKWRHFENVKFEALSARRVSSAHLNYKAHPMIRLVYPFHVYYHMRGVLKRLQTPLPHETSFNAAENPYTESEFFKICEDYRVPNDPMKYRDKKFY